MSSVFGVVGASIFRAGIVILALHVIELVFVYGKLKSIGRSSMKDMLSVLAFGLLFWWPLLKSKS